MRTSRWRPVAAVLAVVGLTIGVASTVHPVQPDAGRPASSTTFPSGVEVDGPLVVNSDGGHVGLLLTGRSGSTYQLLEVDDYLHNPIFSVPPFGGPAVFGDNVRIFHPSAVFGQSITFHFDGSITIGQQVGSDAAPVQQGGPTIYGGSADPNVTPPVHQQENSAGAVVARPLVLGDWYLRSGAAAGLYVWTGSTWLQKL